MVYKLYILNFTLYSILYNCSYGRIILYFHYRNFMEFTLSIMEIFETQYGFIRKYYISITETLWIYSFHYGNFMKFILSITESLWNLFFPLWIYSFHYGNFMEFICHYGNFMEFISITETLWNLFFPLRKLYEIDSLYYGNFMGILSLSMDLLFPLKNFCPIV